MPALVRVTALILALFLSACASVSVDKVQPAAVPPVAPQHIYVQDFSLPVDKSMRVDRGGKALEDFRKKFTRGHTLAVVERVNKRLAPASVLEPGADVPRSHAWLITGRFVTVKQGSRALRATVGFGLGGTKLETLVTVYDLSGRKPRQVLEFETTGGSNAQPGAAIGLVLPNYYLLAADMIVKGVPGLNADMVRTSRQIVAVLSEYMVQENLLDTKKVSRAKKRGKWP